MSSNKNTYTFNFQVVKQLCKKIPIEIQKIAEGQLDVAYQMQQLKIKDPKTNNFCYIFISLSKEGSLIVSSFHKGINITKKQVTNEEQILQFFIISLNIANQKADKAKSISAYQKQMFQLYENLNTKSEKVLKRQHQEQHSAKNEMIAIQEIKQSKEYNAACTFAKALSQEVTLLCKKIKEWQGQTNQKNDKLIETMLEVEKEKELLQEYNYKYNQTVKKMNNVEEYLNKFISEKRAKLKVQDFNDEESFNVYLEDAIALKKLENQKKYLSRG